jgi:hypothetical protein
MRRLLLLVALVSACGDNIKPQATEDAGVQLAPCLEQPTDLPMPPTGQLTCDLLPPGFGAP